MPHNRRSLWILGLAVSLVPPILSSPVAALEAPVRGQSTETAEPGSPSAEPLPVERAGCAGCQRGKCHHHGSSSDSERGTGHGRRGARPQYGMHRPAGRGGPHREEMSTYRALLDNHDSIHRVVEEIPGGVRTVTTSSSPEIVPLIRRHVGQMHRLLVDGGRIRAWDPLFAEIFERADAIEMVFEEIENGVSVTETSKDSAVVELIRAHARKVEDFVARGHAAYEEETPLPAGYERPRLSRRP